MDQMIAPPRKKRGWGRIIVNILFVFSIIANIILFLSVIGLGILIGTGGAQGLMEKTISDGPVDKKIAVINLEGIINKEAEEFVEKQINSATKDKTVKGLILKVQSPGGGVSASDNIHHYITRYKEETGKPIICFMDGLAASGGYYSAVACDRIIASPTTITGSIGVIMAHMDISQLLQEKLGIVPTTIKSGERKDWPSAFREISAEEKKYIFDNVIEPAYGRFVNLVDLGRKNLTTDQVYSLADGSIYFADDAMRKGLVDEVGYFEIAIEAVLKKAGLENAKIVQYDRPFSFSDIMGSQSKALKVFDKNIIREITTPELMYLWNGKNN